MNIKDELPQNGVQLLRIIADKDKNKEKAAKALHLFVGIFESKIKKNVEIIANKYVYQPYSVRF